MSLNLLEFELMLLFLVSLIGIFKGWRFRLLCLSLLNDNCNRCARTCLHYFRYCLDFTCFIFLSFATHFTWLFLRFKFNKLYDNNILKSFLLMWLFHLKKPQFKVFKLVHTNCLLAICEHRNCILQIHVFHLYNFGFVSLKNEIRSIVPATNSSLYFYCRILMKNLRKNYL